MDDLLNEQLGKKNYKRQHGTGFELAGDVTGDDLHDLLVMASDTLRRSGTAKYTDDIAGLESFKTRSIACLDYLREQNDNGGSLTPTVEGWCAYAGISRVTLMHYEQRSERWSEFIGYFKNVLMACKLELASRGKMPPIVFVFDATNNGQRYYNTSEFKLSQTMPEVNTLTMKESPESIASRYRALLADAESKQDVETAENTLI